MATIDYTTFLPVDRAGNTIEGALGVRWSPITEADTGKPYVAPHREEKSVEVSGTFGTGGTVVIEGTNAQVYNTDGTEISSPAPVYVTLNDPQGAALSFATPARLEKIQENANAIRPRATAGTGVSLTVEMIIQSAARR